MLKLKEIQDLVSQSIQLNELMLSKIKDCNIEIVNLEKEFLNILQTQDINLEIKNISSIINPFNDSEWDKNVFSDLIHIFEFEKVQIKGLKTKIKNLLNNRRRLKLFIGYVNRIQQNNGFAKTIYWYNKHNNNELYYKIRTDCFKDFLKDTKIYIDNAENL